MGPTLTISEFQTILSYKVRLCLKKRKEKNIEKTGREERKLCIPIMVKR